MSEFSPPVRIMLGKAGNVTHVVGDAERAGDILLHRWPTSGGSRHLEARKAVLSALERAMDAKAAQAAREAFAAAAEEAGILAPAPPDSGAPKDFKTPHWKWRRGKLKRDQ